MESGDDWSYQAGLKYGWIPKNPTEKKYVRLAVLLGRSALTPSPLLQGNQC